MTQPRRAPLTKAPHAPNTGFIQKPPLPFLPFDLQAAFAVPRPYKLTTYVLKTSAATVVIRDDGCLLDAAAGLQVSLLELCN